MSFHVLEKLYKFPLTFSAMEFADWCGVVQELHEEITAIKKLPIDCLQLFIKLVFHILRVMCCKSEEGGKAEDLLANILEQALSSESFDARSAPDEFSLGIQLFTYLLTFWLECKPEGFTILLTELQDAIKTHQRKEPICLTELCRMVGELSYVSFERMHGRVIKSSRPPTRPNYPVYRSHLLGSETKQKHCKSSPQGSSTSLNAFDTIAADISSVLPGIRHEVKADVQQEDMVLITIPEAYKYQEVETHATTQSHKHHKSHSKKGYHKMTQKTRNFLIQEVGLELDLGLDAFERFDAEASEVEDGHVLLTCIYLCFAYFAMPVWREGEITNLRKDFAHVILCALSSTCLKQTLSMLKSSGETKIWLEAIFHLAKESTLNYEDFRTKIDEFYAVALLKREDAFTEHKTQELEALEAELCLLIDRFTNPVNKLRRPRKLREPQHADFDALFEEDEVEERESGSFVKSFLDGILYADYFFVFRCQLGKNLRDEDATMDWKCVRKIAEENVISVFENQFYQNEPDYAKRIGSLMVELNEAIKLIIFSPNNKDVKKAIYLVVYGIYHSLQNEELLQKCNFVELFHKYTEVLESIAEAGKEDLDLHDLMKWCHTQIEEDPIWSSMEGTLLCQMLLLQALSFKAFGAVMNLHFFDQISDSLLDITFVD